MLRGQNTHCTSIRTVFGVSRAQVEARWVWQSDWNPNSGKTEVGVPQSRGLDRLPYRRVRASVERLCLGEWSGEQLRKQGVASGLHSPLTDMCTYSCLCAHIHTNTCTLHTQTPTCTHTYSYLFVHTDTNTHMYTHYTCPPNMYMCTYSYLCVYIHKTHTCIHTAHTPHMYMCTYLYLCAHMPTNTYTNTQHMCAHVHSWKRI